MLANPKQISPPTDDKRWRFVQATMRRNGFRRSALIETLHSVQESFGFLDEASLQYVATSLRVPLSQVYGVSTFYHLFSLKPAGKHSCVVCTGTACYIKGGPKLLAQVEESYDIKPGETTADEQLSLLTARCVGACGLAPVAVFDGEVLGNLTPSRTLETLRRWSNNDV
ncbi:bidirectional hydrogenase complex protein HoxE [Candidatus Leptofilum sp.]|uniref:bidirectional hydrogenase complex protein HoxE n=1 Tax=Candidatus Leptofilum sp. TaxID=3241576 RepID=UPI003B58E321